MPEVKFISWDKIRQDCVELVNQLLQFNFTHIYGIPTGGAVVAGIMGGLTTALKVIEKEEELGDIDISKVCIIDDLIDSGKTLLPYLNAGHYCATLYGKRHSPVDEGYAGVIYPTMKIFDCWLHFPWEPDSDGAAGPEDAVVRLLEYMGEDPTREGLLETPKRVIKSYNELFSGYGKKPEDVLKVFENEHYNQIVLSRDIQVFSMCEHHMLPFVGKAHVAYIPNGKDVIGLSKLSRLVDLYARRLQIQERLTEQIATTLMNILKPQAAACIIEAQHFCMCMRGVNKQDSTMVTSSVKGKFFEDARARAELMELIKL